MAYIILKTIVFILFFYTAVYTTAWQHELVHQRIYEDYNISSTIKINWISGLWTNTIATTTAYTNSKECPISCRQAHEMNEVVGYNVAGLMTTLFLIFFLYIWTKEIDRIEDKINYTERFIYTDTLSPP